MRRTLITVAALALANPTLAQPILNPSFEGGLTNWFPIGTATLGVTNTIVQDGNRSARLANRTNGWNGIGQSLLGDLVPGTTYTISAHLYADAPTVQFHKITIQQTDADGTFYHGVASVTASGHQWRRLAGTFTYEPAGAVTTLTFYAEGPDPAVDLYLDNVVFEEFVPDTTWIPEANARIDAIRKRDVTVNFYADTGATIIDATADIRQTRRHFGFGTAVSGYALGTPGYDAFLRDNFEWVVPENATKWPTNEPTEGQANYTHADNIVAFCQANNIKMRGHTIFWAVDQFVQNWVQALPALALQGVMAQRISDVVGRYDGVFEHWDINNEMLHGSFYQDRLGPGIRPWMFTHANTVSPDTRWFVNDYNVVSGSETDAYVAQIQGLLDAGAPVEGIGAQGHFFGLVDGNTVLARLDTLAALALPIWLTEVDVDSADENVRADRLETVYRAAFSHPAVDGILMWGFWANAHWRGADSAILDADFTVNAAGQRYQQLMDEWSTELVTPTGAGAAGFRGFHGTYTADITTADGNNFNATFEIPEGDDPLELNIIIPGACPADRDDDGDADVIDLLNFLEDWFALDPAADINADGTTDVLDLLTYIASWFPGC